jgi:hypothetical protein
MLNGQAANHLPKAEFWNPTVIRESAEEVLGASKGTTKKLVAALIEAFAKEKGLADCDKCGGKSSAKLARCPFCGDEDTEEAAEQTEKKKKTAIVRQAKAEVIETKRVHATFADYTAAYKKVQAHKAALCQDFWELGVLCKKIRDERIWMALVDKKTNRPVYKSFEAWLVEESGFQKTYIYGLMGLVESFTEEQVKKFGRTHMLALTTVEPGDRPVLLAELEKKDMSFVEFNKLAAQVKSARKTTKLKPKGEPKARVAVETTPLATPKAITAVFPLERTEVEMFARIQSGEQTKPATDWADQPWGKIELTNGVAVFFGLTRRADGQFVLTVQATRDDG